jgi:hypothetical protein
MEESRVEEWFLMSLDYWLKSELCRTSVGGVEITPSTVATCGMAFVQRSPETSSISDHWNRLGRLFRVIFSTQDHGEALGLELNGGRVLIHRSVIVMPESVPIDRSESGPSHGWTSAHSRLGIGCLRF